MSNARLASETVAEFESTDSRPPGRPPALDGVLPLDDLTERATSARAIAGFLHNHRYRAFFDQIFRCLHRQSPRHIVLVRERGVGEQPVLLELARRGLTANPGFMANLRVLAVDFRHVPLEELRGTLLSTLSFVSGEGNYVLYAEGLARLLRGIGAFDSRTTLLSILSRCRCRVICALSPQENEELVAADPEIQDLFSSIHLHEPDHETAKQLVSQYAAGLEVQFKVKIDPAAVRRSVELTASYILHERLPFKAVKILRAVCDDIAYETSQESSNRREITESDVMRKVADVIGVPFTMLAGTGEEVNYSAALAEVIVGQDQAVKEVATELGLIKAGFADAGKPASVMLFIGQTGTGKTEMAKALARLYSSSKRLKTFTLGNFSEPHSVSGIIGVPAGYVGHDQGGRLVNELNSDPYGVFLLDEADKAHPDVMQPFLNLFDEGWLLDQRGVKGYAERAIFVLTTNVGQRQIADLCKSGKSNDEITATMKESLSRIRHTKSNRPVFSPEFLSRVKRIVVFRSLDSQAMLGICHRLVAQMQVTWTLHRRKNLRVDERLIAAIAQRAFQLDEKSSGKEGGRIVRKLLADYVESPIQAAITADPGQYRRSVSIEVNCVIGSGAEPSNLYSPDATTVVFNISS